MPDHLPDLNSRHKQFKMPFLPTKAIGRLLQLYMLLVDTGKYQLEWVKLFKQLTAIFVLKRMPPWAWGSEVPSDYPELEALSKLAVASIQSVHGEVFKIGTPYMTLNCNISTLKQLIDCLD